MGGIGTTAPGQTRGITYRVSGRELRSLLTTRPKWIVEMRGQTAIAEALRGVPVERIDSVEIVVTVRLLPAEEHAGADGVAPAPLVPGSGL